VVNITNFDRFQSEDSPCWPFLFTPHYRRAL